MPAVTGTKSHPEPLTGGLITPHTPKDLSKSYDLLRDAISGAAHIALLVDFDGTVSPIAATPARAQLDPTIKPVLETMKTREDFSVGIISGRAIEDLRAKAGIDGVIYVGNHGLEIEAGETRFREPQAEALRRELKCVSLQLKLALDNIEGLEIEDKGLTLSVHYRNVHEDMQVWVRDIALETVTKYQAFVGNEGKKVVEIRPALAWNKGHAIKWLLTEVLPPSALPIYIGDDATDEDVFGAIPQGLTIRVGGVPASGTKAHFVLADVAAVANFLGWLTHAKPNASAANAQRVGK
jgi:trehalose 6-phosphate phosphatase